MNNIAITFFTLWFASGFIAFLISLWSMRGLKIECNKLLFTFFVILYLFACVVGGPFSLEYEINHK